jgi:predicted phosphodiesterase
VDFREALGDELARGPSVSESEFKPSVEFTGRFATVSTGTVFQLPDQPPEYEDLLRQFGRDPSRFRLVSVDYEKHWQVPYRPYIRGENGEPVYGDDGQPLLEEQAFRWAASYKLRVEEVDDPNVVANFEEIVKRARVERRSSTGSYWFVFQASDTQLGKRSRDGSLDEIIERYVESVDLAKEEIVRLRRSHGVAGIQISMPGDCIEGGVSQKGQNMGYLTTLTTPQQVTVLERLMLYSVEQFASLGEQVLLTVVNGNHDQSQRQINTNPGDGWATQAATATDIALKMNPLQYGHVSVMIPDEWSGSMTLPVGDTVVTVVHGHQWVRWTAAMTWLSQQAVHNQPAGACQVLQHGHYHTWRTEAHKTKTIVCSSTYDCGSDHYREKHGADARRGGLVYLMRDGEVSRMSLV